MHVLSSVACFSAFIAVPTNINFYFFLHLLLYSATYKQVRMHSEKTTYRCILGNNKNSNIYSTTILYDY